MPALLTAFTDWFCPNCPVTDRSPPLPPGASRFHTCAGLHMLTAPLVAAGTRCTVTAEEREDYLGGEIQATGDDGKPYMAVRTTRDDGCDLAVNAGLAQARLGGLPVNGPAEDQQDQTPAVVVQAGLATAESSVPGPGEDED